MRRCLKNAIYMTLVMSLLMTSLIVAAEPTVTLDPEAPKPEATVTFTATVDDDNVSSVWLNIQECTAVTGICFGDSKQNLSMTEQADGTYEASATLTHDDATYVQYTLFVETSEGWIEYLTDTKSNLDIESDDDGTTNGDGNGGGGIPGFEIIAVLAAISIAIIILRRKRS